MLVASGAPKSDDRTAANIPSVDAMGAGTMPTATWRNATYSRRSPDDVAESGHPAQGDAALPQKGGSDAPPARAGGGTTSTQRPRAITQARVEAAPICRLELEAHSAATAKQTAPPRLLAIAISMMPLIASGSPAESGRPLLFFMGLGQRLVCWSAVHELNGPPKRVHEKGMPLPNRGSV